MKYVILVLNIPGVLGGLGCVVFGVVRLWYDRLILGLHRHPHLLAIVGPNIYFDVVQGALEVVGLMS